jgi:hypothetical protein
MIKITIRGSKEMLDKLKAIPNRMRLALFKATRDTAIAIQSEAKKNAPVFRGLLRNSIFQDVVVNGNVIVGSVGSALPYADVLEMGRTVGWMPNKDQLRLWAQRKFGVPDAGYVVARAILRRGFIAQPYLAPAVESVSPRAQLFFLSRILEALAEATQGSGPAAGGAA